MLFCPRYRKRNKTFFKGVISLVVPFVYASFLVVGSYLLGMFDSQPAEAATHTLTHRTDFKAGKMNGVQADSNEGDLKVKGAGTWGPLVWEHPYVPLTVGTGLVSDGDYIYVLAGRDNDFRRYLPNENRWEELTSPDHSPEQGGDLVILGNYIYAIFGGYTNEFSRYSIIDDTWTDLSDTPDLIFGGGTLGTDGTDIYALRGYNSTDFWRYVVSEDTWYISTSALATIYYGADLVYNSGYFYTPRGNNQTTYYRYDVVGESWDTMTAAPVSFYDVTNADIKDGYIYHLQDRATNTFYRYNILGNTWDTLTTTPEVTRYVGVVYNSSDDQLYVFRGNNQYDFWKYDDATDAFLGPAKMLATPGTGADVLYYNGYLYHPRGDNTSEMYRYSVSGDSWEALTSAPTAFNDDTKGVVAGDYLYFFLGNNTQTFYRYDPVGDSWGDPMTDAPATIRYGGSLVYPGSGDFIYATRGNYTRSFYRYSILGNSWDDVSVADLPDNAEASYGARLATDGTDLYYISGARTGLLLKYTVATDTWSELDNLKFAPYYGTDLTYYNGDLYMQAGYYKPDFWAYNISSGTWRFLEQMGSLYGYERGPYNGGSLESDGAGNLYSIYGQDFTAMQVFTTDTNDYLASGTWTSDVIDLTYVSSWTSLTGSETTPSDSSISYETRTSADQATWTSWEAVSSGTIASTAQRYIQVRATLTASTDRVNTPTLHAVTITYTGDASDPTNPSAFTGSSQQVGGTSISDGSTYGYAHPYFSWSGASDSESGLAGYYVYFGTNSSADPETAGYYQTSVGYEVTEALSSNTYYLRLKTVDVAGNVSSATTGFTYVYQGVASQSVTYTSTADFSSGSVVSVNTASDELKLDSKTGFWIEEQLSLSPANLYYGAGFAYVSSSNKLYTFRGANTTTFYEYAINTDTWDTLAVAPAAVGYGGEVVEGPAGYLYGMAGNNGTGFWRYDITNNIWSDGAATDLPQATRYGSSLMYDGSQYIYVLRGNNDDSFLRYDTTGNSWSTLTSVDFGAPSEQPNNYVYIGGDLAYDGSDTIYAIQGNYRSGFASYSISGNSWSQLPEVPVSTYAGGQIEYDSTENAIYFIPGGNKPYFYKYSISSGTWSELSEGPNTFYYGTSMRNVGGKLYIARGYNSRYFYTYDTTDDTWLIPTRGLFGGYRWGADTFTFNYGAEITKGSGDYLYMTRGSYDNLLIRYDTSSGESVELAGAPSSFYVGGTIAYESTNDKIYAAASQYDDNLYVYDVATNVWTNVSTDPFPVAPSQGTSMAYDGSRYMYWARGGNTTTFYRYDTQGSAGSRWGVLTNAPGNLGYGSQLVYKDSYIYVMRGANVASNPIYRYDTGGGSWYTGLAAAPGYVNNDGFLVDSGGDYLYACRGGNTTDCYSYSVGGDSWDTISDAPANIYYGGSAVSDGTAKMYVIAGPGTNTFNDGLYTYVMQTDASSFESSGTFTSTAHDLTAVYRFANISLTYTTATNATLSIETRTSANGSDWSEWVDASAERSSGTTYTYKINSTANRYIQVRFTLTSGDSIYSGVISDYTINYYQDTTTPTNPTSVSGYSDSGMGTSINSGSWYAHSAPHFDWPAAEAAGGATDTSSGSGVAGYYAYFGTNALADPESLGSLITATEYTASSMTSGQTYYLRVKTVDDAGNVSASAWDAFTYRYDATAPSAPSALAADPSGYSAVDSFDFSWTAPADTGSGVASYCYKTGASSGAYSVDQCQVGTSITSVPSYKSGANTFYVRALDNAGNYSEYATVSFYYSSGAPSAPQSLAVTPSSNTSNSFAFSWAAPAIYFGSEANLTYHYSINALPTASSTTETTATSLVAGAYATLPGENTFYIVAEDEATNVDYNNYSSITFTANTTAPGVPLNEDIADVSVKATSSWKIAVSWEEPASAGSGVASYQIYRSTSSGSGFTYVANTSGISYVDTGLTQQTYYYKVKACDSANNCGAFSGEVSMYPDGKFTTFAPLVAEPEVTSITTKKATVSWSTSRTSDSKVAYGTSSGDYLDEEVSSSEHVTSHVINLTNLSPGTTYYFVAKWTDEDGNTGTSDEYTFDTDPPPSSKEISAVNIGLTTTSIQFTSENASAAKIYYGKSTDFGGTKTVAVSTEEATYTVQLDGLEDGTKYYYKVNLTDVEDEEYEGDTYSFETLPRPEISGVVIQQIKGTARPTVFVSWETNTEVSSVVTYYPQDNPGGVLDKVNVALETGRHRMIISDLLPNKSYTFIVSGKDKIGNETKSEDIAFTTSVDNRAPLISNIKVEGSTENLSGSEGDTQMAQLIVSWNTDEPATSQVEFGEGSGTTYAQKTQEDTNLTYNHLVIISGLTPSKVYHLRAISKDIVGNATESVDTVTITPKSTGSALDLVISSLQGVFGFLGSVQ